MICCWFVHFCDKFKVIVEDTGDLVSEQATFSDTFTHEKPHCNLDADDGVHANILKQTIQRLHESEVR